MSGEAWLPLEAWDPAGRFHLVPEQARDLGFGLQSQVVVIVRGEKRYPSYWDGAEFVLWASPLVAEGRGAANAAHLLRVGDSLRVEWSAKHPDETACAGATSVGLRDLLSSGSFAPPKAQSVASRAHELEADLRTRRVMASHAHSGLSDAEASHVAWLGELLARGPLTAAVFGSDPAREVDEALLAVADGLAAGVIDDAVFVGDVRSLGRRWSALAARRPRRTDGSLRIVSEEKLASVAPCDLVVITRPARLARRDVGDAFAHPASIWLLDDTMSDTEVSWLAQWEDRHRRIDVVGSRTSSVRPRLLRWRVPNRVDDPSGWLGVVRTAVESGGVPGRVTGFVVVDPADRRVLMPSFEPGREAAPLPHPSGAWLIPDMDIVTADLDVVVATVVNDALLAETLAGRVVVVATAPETLESAAADILEPLWNAAPVVRAAARDESLIGRIASGSLTFKQGYARVARLTWEAEYRSRRMSMGASTRRVQPAAVNERPSSTAKDVEAWQSLLGAAHEDTATFVPRSPGVLTVGPGAAWPLSTADGDTLTLDIGGGAGEDAVDAYPGSTGFQAAIDALSYPVVSAEVVAVPDLDAIPVPEHGQDVEFVRRGWRRPREVKIAATCLVSSLGQPRHVREVAAGRVSPSAHARVWLSDDAHHHPGLPVMSAISRALRDAERQARREAEFEGRQVAGVRIASARILGGADLTIRHVWRRRDGQELETLSPFPRHGPPVLMGQDGTPIRRLGICTDLHAVEVDTLVRCPACDADLCEFCDGGTYLSPCPLCLEPACTRCLESGACVACRNPRRVPQYDTASERAWQLRSGLLFVSRGGARLEQGGHVVRLGPAADVSNVLRVAAREAAVAAGVAWDTPVLASAPAATQQKRSMSWTVAEQTRWVARIVEGPEELPEFDRPDLLPRAHGVPIVPLDQRGAKRVTERLRAIDPPSATVALVAHAVVDVTRLELTIDGFQVRRVQHDDAGSPSEEVHEVDLAPVRPVVTDDGIVVAEVTFGGVSVTLLRVHRGFLMRVDDHGSIEEYWHGPPDAPVERAWHRILDSLGVASPAIIRVPANGVPHEQALALATPSSSQLVERTVTVRPFLAGLASKEAQPPTAEDLVALSRHALEWDVRTIPKPAARGLDSAIDLAGIAAPVTVSVTSAHIIQETWQGHGRAKVEFEAQDGTVPSRPVIGATHTETDFEVDTAGHLHVPDIGWLCRACREHCCPGCPSDRLLVSCPTCEQPACKKCVDRGRTGGVGAPCSDCGRRECQHCQSTNDLTPCTSCRRDVCWHCLQAGICEVCATLGDDVAPPNDALKALGVDPASVRTGRTPAGEIVLSVHQGRRWEVAVWDADRIASWSVDEGNPFPQTDAALSRRLGAPAECVVDGLTPDELELVSGEVDVGDQLLRWRHHRIRIPAIDADLPVSQLETLDQRLAQAAQEVERLPEPTRVTELRSLGLPFAEGPSIARPRVDVTEYLVHLVLGEDGLEDRATATVLDFQPLPAKQGRWGQRVASASAGAVTAFLERVARARLIVFEGAFGHHVLIAAQDRNDVALLDVQNVFGLPEPVPITSVLKPSAVLEGGHIRGAEIIDTVLEPIVEVDDAKGNEQLLSGRTIERWLQQSALPLLGERSRWAWGAVAGLPEGGSGWSAGRVARLGYRVHHVVEQDARVIELRFDMWPPSRRPRLVWGDVESPSIIIDREGHGVAEATPCALCRGLTCTSCRAAARPCQLCRINVCPRCRSAAALHLCPACGSLERSPIRTLKRVVGFRPKAAARGEDSTHRVDVVVNRNGALGVWVRPAGVETSRRVQPSPAALAHLRGLFQ